MDEIAKWLLEISGADLAVGAAAGLAAASLLTMLTSALRRRVDDGKAEQTELEQRQRLLLSCGDVKALTDLAIQRHMSDVAFLQRFQAQPCYTVLSPHFSEKFREHLAKSRKHGGHAELAAACREECERLERLWQVC